MIEVNCEYKIKEDIGFIIEAEKINALELSEATKISRTTFNAIGKRGSATDEVCEKLYAYIYRHNYRINSVKEELIRSDSQPSTTIRGTWRTRNTQWL